MTTGEVREVRGHQPSGWVYKEARWADTYSLRGITVRYRLDEESAYLRLVVEEVEAAPACSS